VAYCFGAVLYVSVVKCKLVVACFCSFDVSVRSAHSGTAFFTHTITSKNGAVYTVVLAWHAVCLTAQQLLLCVVHRLLYLRLSAFALITAAYSLYVMGLL